MTDDKADKKALERFEKLREKRLQILALPPKKAMDRILEDPQPAALVHSFPEQDFYFLIHDIGAGDSLPLPIKKFKKAFRVHHNSSFRNELDRNITLLCFMHKVI